MKLLSRAKPLALPDLEIHELAALKCVAKGEATPEQQIAAYEIIIKKIAAVGSLSMNEDPHVTAFCEGKRFVGLALLHIASEPMDKLKTKKENNQ